ncbi:TPA: hypothetical protein ACF5V2_004188, partial [Enterobacter kobei]
MSKVFPKTADNLRSEIEKNKYLHSLPAPVRAFFIPLITERIHSYMRGDLCPIHFPAQGWP